MANQKISALTALTGANVEQLADVLPIVDNSASATKKILVSELAQAMLVLGTAQATTSGTSIDFTSIPAWVKRVTINFVGVSTSGTSNLLLQIGDSGGIETSGYLSRATDNTSGATSTAGYILTGSGVNAASIFHGSVTLCLQVAATFTWVSVGVLTSHVDAVWGNSAGSKSTSAALDRIRITTVNGSDTFDAGSINILFD